MLKDCQPNFYSQLYYTVGTHSCLQGEIEARAICKCEFYSVFVFNLGSKVT